MRTTATALIAAATTLSIHAAELRDASPSKLPRWRGFNLLEKFYFSGEQKPFLEADFRMISELGFNFVRLPMDYRGYISDKDWEKFDETPLSHIDQAIEWGGKYKVIVATVSSRATLTLSADGTEIAREEFIADPADKRWQKVEHMKRWDSYRADGAVELRMAVPDAATNLELRTVDGDWLSLKSIAIIAPDGSEAKVGLGTQWAEAAETLRYLPADKGGPLLGQPRGREWLRDEEIKPWRAFESKGGGVMVGEWGAYNKTPHKVVLPWAEACLRNWKEAGWGWALWNFRGSFGILDSERKDVTYEDYQGHKLDRELLEILQRY